MGYQEALEDMVWRFGYRGVRKGQPIIQTGGLSTLKEAFGILGWDDPHYLPEEGYTCDTKGCMEADTCGVYWGGSKLYLRLCSWHYYQARSGIPMPEIKQYALDREARREPISGHLSIQPV